MPLLQNEADWETWKKDNLKGYNSVWKKDFTYNHTNDPQQFPCWLIAVYQSQDCHPDYYETTFIYQDEQGHWDLQTYEDEEGWCY